MPNFIFQTTILGLANHVFWIIVACAAVTVLAVVLIIIFALKANKKSGGGKAPKIKVKNRVRYSKNGEYIEIGNNVNVTHNQGDIAIAKGKSYTAGKKRGDLLPGKYTVLTTAQGEDKFMIRLGKFAREYAHGDTIVIPEGETIIATSHSVLLR